VDDLRKKRDALDAEIARVLAGDVPLLDDTAVKDRFQQFQQLARELLADFREVEHNFRLLDRKVREKIALWEGAKGALLDEIMGERDAIGDSDQGRSFRAFWDFLMSSRRQEELSERLDQVLALPAVARFRPNRAPAACTTTGWRQANTRSARWPSCRSSCAASWTTGPFWRTAASWTCCTASRARRWLCAERRPPGWSCTSTPWRRTSNCRWSGPCSRTSGWLIFTRVLLTHNFNPGIIRSSNSRPI
jgi:hypothetical protein